MPLRLGRRPGSPYLWITGTIRGRRIRESSGTDSPALAEEARAAREAELYRAAVHGARPTVAFAAAAESYLRHAGPHSAATLARLRRVSLAIGARTTLAEIDQGRIDSLAARLLRPASSQATRLREVTTPIRAVLTHAARRGWCDLPAFETPDSSPARTEWLTPAEADRLEAAAAPHLRPLIVFLLATGARLGEALKLQWQDVDLVHARALFRGEITDTAGRRSRGTKSGADRPVDLCPRAIAALASLQGRIGHVFRTRAGHRYQDRRQQGGGQVKTAWHTALRRADLATRPITPHTCRHTWATWHAAIHRDPLLLRHEGGWSSLDQVDRYAKLAPKTLVPDMQSWRAPPAQHPAEEHRHAG